MKIPLKKVSVAQVIQSHLRGVKIIIDGESYIGTEYLILKESFATQTFINRVNKLKDIRNLDGKIYFKFSQNLKEYGCLDNEIKDFKLICANSIIVLNTKIGKVGVNYDYYSYLKKYGITLGFNKCCLVIGLFKNNEFLGVMFPVKIKED